MFTGESYIDCCHRLRPFLEELELECRSGDPTSGVLVVAHQAILRCILGYFLKSRLDDIPFIRIPQHTVMQLTSMPKYDSTHCNTKTFHDHPDDSANEQSQTFACIDDDVCSIEYVRMPIEYAEQGVVSDHVVSVSHR